MPKIILTPKHCQIIEEDDLEFVSKLRQQLSFFVQGAERSKAYKGYMDESGKQVTWDGHKRLISETLKFAPGLLERVQKFYTYNNRPFELVNLKPPTTIGQPTNILQKLIASNRTPYPYQLEAVRLAGEHNCGIFRMATGSGKSITMALMIAELGKSSIVFVIGKDLLYQMYDLFKTLFDDKKIGIIGDGRCEIGEINVATVWTVSQAFGLDNIKRADDEEDEKNIAAEKYKDIRELVGKIKVAFFDECHLCACDSVQGICKRLNPENIYGFSASPWRDDGADLLIENYLGGVIFNLPAKKLIEEGYLVKPLIKFLSVPPHDKKKGQYKTIYKDYITQNNVRNEMIVKGANKLVEQGYQTLVLFHSIAHGQLLYKKLSKDLRCAILSGEDDSKKRNKIREKIENKKIDCIIASKIYDCGVDLPSISGLIIGGGGKSSVRALQRIGRVIRKAPNKTNAAVIDFADQAPYLFEHAQIRRKIYEKEFEVIWPGEKKK